MGAPTTGDRRPPPPEAPFLPPVRLTSDVGMYCAPGLAKLPVRIHTSFSSQLTSVEWRPIWMPRSSNTATLSAAAMRRAAVRTSSGSSSHTALNASRMMRTSRALISSSDQKKLEKSCTHSK